MRGDAAVVLVDPIATGAPFKRAARRRGLAVISLVTIPDGLLKMLTTAEALRADADHIIRANRLDDAVRGIMATGFDVRGVVPATEPGVDLAEALACSLRLTGNWAPPGARRDKARMRECVAAQGLATPRFARCSCPEDVASFIQSAGLPVVVKTPKGAGTCQVSVCGELEGAVAAFVDCVSRPDLFGNTTDFALVEEFVDGPEYALNFFFCGTQVTFVDIWRYAKEERLNCGPIYRSMVQPDPEELADTGLVPYALAACRAVGVRLGPAHVEVKLGPRGPVLMEVGARLSGARIPELWERYSDLDPFTTTLSIYVGEPVRMPARITFSKHLGIAFCPIGEREAGEVVAIEGLTEIQRLASFVDAAISVRVGAYAEPTRDLETLAGMVHLANDDPEALLRDVKAVHCSFRVVSRVARGEQQCTL